MSDAVTRGSFLARGALATGALYGAAGAARALAHGPQGAFTGGDIGIVNFALTLEKVEGEVVKSALGARRLSPAAKELLESIAADDAEHVKSLNQSITQLGGKAGPAPRVRAPAVGDEREALETVAELKDTAVAAYNGAATQIRSADLLQAMASIAQVEARHAGALREFAKRDATRGPFDEVYSGTEADEAVHGLTG